MQNYLGITYYDAICNLGNGIDEIFSNAIKGNSDFLTPDDTIIQNQLSYFGKVNCALPEISDKKYNLRCNKLVLYLINKAQSKIKNLINVYGINRISVVVATTNSGVQEFEKSRMIEHSEIGNPSEFIAKYLGVTGFNESISTACSSGIKAFSSAKKLIENNIADCVIVFGCDPLAKLPIYGFNSLEVLSKSKTNPFSKNRSGINIGEGAAIFVLEKNMGDIIIKGIGETSDSYHATTPNPDADEAKAAIKIALAQAKLSPKDINYINLHGTGTIANDLMEARAVYDIFGDETPASSTKSMTGHCLGAAASIESALCCHVLRNQMLLPHVYDGNYDTRLPKINLIEKSKPAVINNVLCNSFGFGGTNAVIVLGREIYE